MKEEKSEEKKVKSRDWRGKVTWSSLFDVDKTDYLCRRKAEAGNGFSNQQELSTPKQRKETTMKHLMQRKRTKKKEKVPFPLHPYLLKRKKKQEKGRRKRSLKERGLRPSLFEWRIFASLRMKNEKWKIAKLWKNRRRKLSSAWWRSSSRSSRRSSPRWVRTPLCAEYLTPDGRPPPRSPFRGRVVTFKKRLCHDDAVSFLHYDWHRW